MEVVLLTEIQRKNVTTKIVEALIHALQEDKVTEMDAREVSRYILLTLDGVATHERLVEYLSELANHWQFFSQLVKIEQGEIQESKEDTVTEQVIALTKQGNITEAVALAKSMTQKP